MSTIYFIFGVIQASTGFATYIFLKQETFAQMEKEHLLVHHQKSRYEIACKEMDELLGILHQKASSICVRQGKEVRRYEL